MELVHPSTKYKNSFLAAAKAHLASGEHDGLFDSHAEWTNEHFDEYLARTKVYRSGKNLPEGKVPSSSFWIVDDDTWLGRVSLRHELNDTLKSFGGHLGYYLIPSARKKGIGSWAVEHVLEEARKLGLKKLLVTCNPDNIGSQKIIQKFGGIHQDTIDSELNDGPLMRWWITL